MGKTAFTCIFIPFPIVLTSKDKIVQTHITKLYTGVAVHQLSIGLTKNSHSETDVARYNITIIVLCNVIAEFEMSMSQQAGLMVTIDGCSNGLGCHLVKVMGCVGF